MPGVRTATAAPARRTYLSPPDVGEEERRLLLEAFDSGWLAPLGPHVDAFEAELAASVGAGHAAALSSGTAALHLALRLVGVGPGDDVLTATLTFAATANAVTYLGARPVFVDCDPATWQLDPALLVDELDRRARRGRLPKAVVTVDLYGQCCDYEPILEACARYDIPVVEDAAEALGAAYRDAAAGTLGVVGVYSFNGNKIITTSGGGALVSDRGDLVAEARRLAAQARDPVAHYEHSTVGYNYRLSNLLAALGRGQLRTLPAKIGARRETNARYRAALGDLPGVAFMPAAHYGRPTWWLTCLTIDPEAFGATRDEVIARLDAHNIEARPVWKPLHLQLAFAACPAVGGAVATRLFERGLCLPSGSNLDAADRQRVVDVVRRACRAR